MQKKSGIMKSGLNAMPLFLLDDLLMIISYLQVNTVIQIPTTTVRILLNHFKWDKEKLMERYYSDDQEAMYVLIIILLILKPFKFVLLLQL